MNEEIERLKKNNDANLKCYNRIFDEMYTFMGPIRRWIYEMKDNNAFRRLVYRICKFFKKKED